MTKRTCTIPECGKPHVARGYCEHHYGAAKTRGDFEVTRWASDSERFWAKVEKTDNCWIWRGAKNATGYGGFRIGGRLNAKILRAHRFSYAEANGPIPEGLVVDHMCHNPSCVRPSHMRVGTQKQNAENQGGVNGGNKNSFVRNVHKTSSKTRPWRVAIRHHGVLYTFGTYATIAEAEVVAKRERARLFTFAD